jgi:hypothetical protein
MTSFIKITASIALAATALVGLAACSSGSSSSTSSSASPSTAASSAASAAASAPASSVPVNIAPDVVAAYFKAVCLAPAAKLGVEGALNADGTVCTTPEGKDVPIDQISSNLGDPTARFSVMANYYSIAGATDVADCLTIAEAKKALSAPAPAELSDTCVSNLLTAVAESLSTK